MAAIRRNGRDGVGAHDRVAARVLTRLQLDVLACSEVDGFRLVQGDAQLHDVVGQLALVNQLALEAPGQEQFVRDGQLDVTADFDLAGQPDVVLAVLGCQIGLLHGADHPPAVQDLDLAVRTTASTAAGRGDENVVFGQTGKQGGAAIDDQAFLAIVDVQGAGAVVQDTAFGEDEQNGQQEGQDGQKADGETDGSEH
jgi:hypothetical protein